jgi:ferritin-like metal-binding protein YciE
MEETIKDAALIAAAQRVEHYEIAGYGCVCAYAAKLGDKAAASLLSQTLAEEKEADETLNDIAEELNIEV